MGGGILGGQTGKVGLGWILKAILAVLKSSLCGWACWPVGAATQPVLLPSEHFFISLYMIISSWSKSSP